MHARVVIRLEPVTSASLLRRRSSEVSSGFCRLPNSLALRADFLLLARAASRCALRYVRLRHLSRSVFRAGCRAFAHVRQPPLGKRSAAPHLRHGFCATTSSITAYAKVVVTASDVDSVARLFFYHTRRATVAKNGTHSPVRRGNSFRRSSARLVQTGRGDLEHMGGALPLFLSLYAR